MSRAHAPARCRWLLLLTLVCLLLAGCDLGGPTPPGSTPSPTPAQLGPSPAASPSPATARSPLASASPGAAPSPEGGRTGAPATVTPSAAVASASTPADGARAGPPGSPSPAASRVVGPGPSPAASAAPADGPPGETPPRYLAARAEGRLLYYTSETVNEVQGLVAAFQARYPGIVVDYWRADTAAIAERLVDEAADRAATLPGGSGPSGGADVVFIAPGADPAPFLGRDLLAAYTPPDTATFPPEATAGAPPNRLHPVVLGVRTFAFNTRRAATPPAPTARPGGAAATPAPPNPAARSTAATPPAAGSTLPPAAATPPAGQSTPPRDGAAVAAPEPAPAPEPPAAGADPPAAGDSGATPPAAGPPDSAGHAAPAAVAAEAAPTGGAAAPALAATAGPATPPAAAPGASPSPIGSAPAGPPPRTWLDLADPSWRGRIGLLDPRAPGGDWLVRLRPALGDEAWQTLVAGLARQEPRLYPSYTALQLALAAGEIAVMAPAVPGAVEAARLQGAEIDWARSPDPLIADPGWVGVLNAAPHPAAARLFVDFLQSEAGQRLIAAQGRVPARLGIDVPYLGAAPLRILSPAELAEPISLPREIKG